MWFISLLLATVFGVVGFITVRFSTKLIDYQVESEDLNLKHFNKIPIYTSMIKSYRDSIASEENRSHTKGIGIVFMFMSILFFGFSIFSLLKSLLF